jgi:hypothetical protein
MNGIADRLKKQDETLKRLMDNVSWDIRVAIPGIIKSFNATKQTVEVQVAIRERVVIDGVLSWETIPILVDVPIVIPRAGGYMLTLPIEAGDECLVVFADACIDAWYQSGDVQNQIDRRRHDLSDGFAIIGTWSQPNVIANYSTDKAQLRNEAGTSKVELDDTTINLTTTGIINLTAATLNIQVAAMNMNADGTGAVAIKGQTISIDSTANATTIEGRDFLVHHHTGVSTGSGNTGDVV